ncbi:hypothetical protein H2198_003960 [Neophaeococcomyces mojaviensis]|uniref:Uncharacterized protein n=1 Tax=Neophaeococcomyces mojaviensis TaxID=3383035 RepID=A0ACC3A9Y7_9EURO|nr:hypothetical protein H2198_003960 [Knufia sp. JES_112]
MDFMRTGSEAQWLHSDYADYGPAKYYPVHPSQHSIWTGSEPAPSNFRHHSLSSSVVDLHRSMSDEGQNVQILPPPCRYPYLTTEGLNPQQPTQGWTLGYEATRTLRYMSPNGPHGGSISDSSASSESAYTSDAQSYPIRYSQSPVNVPRQYTFKAFEVPSPSHMPWPTAPPTSYTAFPTQYNTTYLSSYNPKELQFQQRDDTDLESPFDEEVIHVQEDSPMQRLEPEELELTLVHTESSVSSMGEERHGLEPEQSDEEFLNDEIMSIDNDHADSDPDYDSQPRRRTNSRGTASANKRNLRSPRSPRSPRHARRPSNLNRSTVLGPGVRVQKSGPSSNASSSTSMHVRRSSKSKAKPKPAFAERLAANAKQEAMNKSDRTFPCTFHHFGCTSEFPNKNEWKRHVAYQHLQLGYFRCDLDNCDPDNKPSHTNARRTSSSSKSAKPKVDRDNDSEEIVKIYNDFNRKDLFTQHCRRMHGPARNPTLCSNPPTKRGSLQPTKDDEAAFEKMLDGIRKRCWHVRRQAPERSSCGFCNRVFDAEHYQNQSGDSNPKDDVSPEEKAWEARMEHIGRHYEKDNVTKFKEDADEDLVDWGLNNGVLRRLEDGRAWLVSLEVPQASGPVSRGTVTSGDDAGQESRARYPRKARRQPSKTVEIHKRTQLEEGDEIKQEEVEDSDDDAEGESDPAAAV